MNEFARPDLLLPDEAPYPAAHDPRPVFGTGSIVASIPEGLPQTNLRFIYGVDGQVDSHGLAEQIGDSEVIIYCSDWGSGEPDVPGLADAIEAEVRHFQDPDNGIEDIEMPEGIHPVIQTLIVEMQGAEREFYCAGNFEPDEDINALDVARSQAHAAMGLSVAEFRPVDESIKLMNAYTSRAVEYNNAVEQRAYEQITDILQEHGGQQIAVICQNSFPLLPRYFRGDEADPAITMTRYHMPWAKLISALVKVEDIGRAMAEEKGEEFESNKALYDPAGFEPAHRPLMEQIIFLKQVGAEVSSNLYYNSLYSLIANHVVAAGDLYGPDVEYRMVDRPHDARDQLEFFETKYWPEIRGDNGESKEVMSTALMKFMKTWLRISI